MVRLTNEAGAIVDVPEEKVARLGPAWTRIDESAAAAAEGYGGWKVAELKAEVERRNEGRAEDSLILPEGKTRADLIAALEADDEATAAADAASSDQE